MIRSAALLAVMSCIPDQEPIGTTEWAQAGEDARILDVGRHGDQVLITNLDTYMIGGDGQIRWRTPYAESIVDLAIDVDGSVAVLSHDGSELSLARLGTDGQVEYVRTIPDVMYESSGLVVIDARNVTWVVLDPLGDEPGRWAQVARDGSLLGAGVLDFRPTGNARALPTEGILVPDRDGGLVEIGSRGEVRWRFDGEVRDYVVHEDGELTLLQDKEIVRLASDREPRWRRSLAATAISGVSDGSVVLSGMERILYEPASTAITRIDRDGPIEQELIDSYMSVVPSGPPIDGYRVYIRASGVVDFHDRTVESLGYTLVARRLP